ncbi:MAG: DUF1272 domain-containing protein [Gaiellales bacterium]
MLELRPICEHCGRSLPPESTEAMICSFECTFCRSCVDGVLGNVCPNCGGGFERRPVRPTTEWRTGLSITQRPATETRYYRPVDRSAHEPFATPIRAIPPAER